MGPATHFPATEPRWAHISSARAELWLHFTCAWLRPATRPGSGLRNPLRPEEACICTFGAHVSRTPLAYPLGYREPGCLGFDPGLM